MLFVNFTFHLHQPVGNFGFVVDKAYEDAYRPFIDALLEHPFFRCNLHVSGSLFDHLSQPHPEFMESIQELCARDQVEMLASGYYEPILTEIPANDAYRQVELMREFIQNSFGQQACGFWCSERVYDQNLPEIAQKSGLAYTLLDDYLMLREVEEEQLFRHHAVNEKGCELAVFPISEKLRYLVPFQPVSKLEAHLREKSARYAERGIKAPLAVFGDDGEKFGVWPGTKEWVYKSGWLKDFFAFFKQSADIFPLVHLGEFCEVHPPAGKTSLPAGSYREMCEWVLPARRQRDIARAKAILTAGGMDKPEQVLFSGNFKHFRNKYEESRRLHYKNRNLSTLVAKAESCAGGGECASLAALARKNLLESQCNCAYWHGVFGGLYLNYLREAINERMVSAENAALQILKPCYPELVCIDYYENRRDCILFRNEAFTMLISPYRGLAVDWCDYRPAGMALLSGMGRYYEYYHDQLFLGQSQRSADPNASIHESVRLKDNQALSKAAFDSYLRLNFVDVFQEGALRIPALYKGELGTAVGLWDCSYSVKLLPNGVCGDADTAIGSLEKIITACGNTINISFSLQPYPYITGGTFASEFNLNLLTDRGGRWAEYEGSLITLGETWESETQPSELSFVDTYRNVRIIVKPEGLTRIGFYPVRTLAMSEGGADLTYQAQAVAIFRDIRGGEPARFGLSLSVIPT